MARLAMQIVCPNCATAYEIPDAAFGGRARKLRCESCGTQWRAGPPGSDTAPASSGATAPGLADYGPPPPVAGGRVFGKPADASAQAEFQEAMDREATERAQAFATAAPATTAPATATPEAGPEAGDAGPDPNDPFINLVMAARSRAIEFEPETPPQPLVHISSRVLVGTLLTLFVLSVGFLIVHSR